MLRQPQDIQERVGHQFSQGTQLAARARRWDLISERQIRNILPSIGKPAEEERLQ